MIKKILPVILCLCLVFGISAMAVNSTDSTGTDTPAVTEEMPMPGGGGMRGGRGGRGGPQGESAESREMPAMPDGGMPRGERMAPDNGGNTENKNVQQTQPASEENVSGEATDTTNENTNRMQRGGMGGQGGMQGNTQSISETSEAQSQGGILGFVKTYSTPILSVILLILAFVFVAFYKRKSY